VPFDEALTFLLDTVVVREGFHELAARHNPLILSGGFHQTIEPLLAREGVSLEVKANRIDPRLDGWLIEWRDPEPCEVCGELCKRRNLPTDRPMAYIGDGYSDRCAALAADRIFARDALARHLDAEGVPFERFDTLTEVVAALAA
jgi:2-hydroxy-3-keto-5-methylthiopentenyl-1-phosphate phosphatase